MSEKERKKRYWIEYRTYSVSRREKAVFETKEKRNLFLDWLKHRYHSKILRIWEN
jgi:hypothetical protein